MMAITNDDIQKALRIKRCVSEYFENYTEAEIQAKELMPQFIAKGIFNKNSQDGLPIRKFLRHLEEEKQLGLIPQALNQQKDKNMNWYFIKTK